MHFNWCINVLFVSLYCRWPTQNVKILETPCTPSSVGGQKKTKRMNFAQTAHSQCRLLHLVRGRRPWKGYWEWLWASHDCSHFTKHITKVTLTKVPLSRRKVANEVNHSILNYQCVMCQCSKMFILCSTFAHWEVPSAEWFRQIIVQSISHPSWMISVSHHPQNTMLGSHHS